MGSKKIFARDETEHCLEGALEAAKKKSSLEKTGHRSFYPRYYCLPFVFSFLPLRKEIKCLIPKEKE